MKPRINVYLEDHVAAQLTLVCKRPGANKSRIVNDALDRFFNPEQDTETNSALIRRLDRMSGAMERMDRNQSIEVETLALFIRYFLTITPPLPESEQASAHALGKERFEVFVAQVGRRLAQDRNLLSEVLERIADASPDLFAVDPQRATASQSTGDTEKPNQPEEALPPLRAVVVEDDDPAFSEDEFIEDMEWEGDDDR
jgi:pantothenate kinase-related protein Tda10